MNDKASIMNELMLIMTSVKWRTRPDNCNMYKLVSTHEWFESIKTNVNCQTMMLKIYIIYGSTFIKRINGQKYIQFNATSLKWLLYQIMPISKLCWYQNVILIIRWIINIKYPQKIGLCSCSLEVHSSTSVQTLVPSFTPLYSQRS